MIPGNPIGAFTPFNFTNWTEVARVNTPPTITTADHNPLARLQGTTGNVSIAKVSDSHTSAGNLTVTATNVPSGLSVNGIVNTNGTVTADVGVECSTASGFYTIEFSVMDGELTATANFVVQVLDNAPPQLSYGSASVISGGSTTIDATFGPSDNGSVQTIAVQSQGTYSGGISVDANGKVTINSAAPVGSHTITIRATDNCGAQTNAQFTLTVTDAANTCSSVGGSRNWSSASTWGCGHVPGANDAIIIQSGQDVILDVDPLGTNTTVNPGAILTILGNRTLASNLIVNGTLNFGLPGPGAKPNSLLSNSILITGNSAVEIACDGVITGASSANFIVGNLQKDYCATGVFTYAVGTNGNGDQYSPVAVNVTALGVNPSSLTVKSSYGTAPATPPLVDANTLDRYWLLTESGDLTADLTFNYLASDVTAPEGNHRILRITGLTAVSWPNSAPDTVNHKATASGVSAFSDWTLSVPAAPTASGANISGRVTTAAGQPLGGVTVKLSGSQSDRTISNANGEYAFPDLETNGFYTVTPAQVNYLLSPSNRSFTLVGNKTDAVFTATSTGESANAIDGEDFFVRQQYLDLLDREPDHDGWLYWTDQISRCGDDVQCVRHRRVEVSAAFFVEQEFQLTGTFVYRLYRGSLGRQPSYAEFTSDRGRVRASGNLEANKTALVDEWMNREEFAALYPASLTNVAFVTKLFAQAGLANDLAEQEQQIAALNGGRTRTDVLRAVIELPAFKAREYNPSFVLMQYFGYLRRDADPEGYDFWLNVLNNTEPNNYRGMVCSFVTSTEYQRRFSSVVTRSNAECGQ